MTYSVDMSTTVETRGCCEWCDAPGMTNETVHEGDLGWYCSEECEEAAEGGDYTTDASSRQWEGRQMGITG